MSSNLHGMHDVKIDEDENGLYMTDPREVGMMLSVILGSQSRVRKGSKVLER